MHPSLSPQDLAVIQEEESNLLLVQKLSRSQAYHDNRQVLLDQMIEIREQMNDANSDDLPALTDQLAQLTNLVNQSDQSDAMGLDPFNPYFGRFILEQEGQTKDFYLGTRVFVQPGLPIQVIDWKTSPVSAIYFRYQPGDEYEEELGGRLVEGELLVKRMLKIEGGILQRIEEGERVLARHPLEGWQVESLHHTRLKGGSGSAIRPENARASAPALGGLNPSRSDKSLQDITGLMDQEQFNLITQPQSGILAIQGTAGSGKTTVALHRVAWLHHQDPKRFAPQKMIVMVFNKALANYIAKVLPSLGVDGVKIDFFERWASQIRGRLFGGLLPLNQYNPDTPAAVIRFKKHPLLLKIIQDFLAAKEQAFKAELERLVAQKAMTGFPWQAVQALPLVRRHKTLWQWAEGKESIAGKKFPYGAEAATLLKRSLAQLLDPELSLRGKVMSYWEELFSDFSGLMESFQDELSQEFTAGQLQDAVSWLKRQHQLLQEYSPGKGKEGDGLEAEEPQGPESFLDYEDDAILIYMYQLLAGEITAGKDKALKYSHLLIDEAQDLSPIELKLLVGVAAEPKSITFAGDVHQRLVKYNAFAGWNQMFDYLGFQGQEIKALKVSYRSTRQIMEFALDLLGDLVEQKDSKTVKEGPPVRFFRFAHQGEEASYLAESLRDLMLKEPNASLAVICFSPEQAVEYHRLLEHMEIPRLRLVEDQEFTFTAGIDVTDIKQVKGLEFDYVVLVGVDQVNYPDHSYSRYLLHVGATRAAHQLWMTSYRLPSSLLPPEMQRA